MSIFKVGPLGGVVCFLDFLGNSFEAVLYASLLGDQENPSQSIITGDPLVCCPHFLLSPSLEPSSILWNAFYPTLPHFFMPFIGLSLLRGSDK